MKKTVLLLIALFLLIATTAMATQYYDFDFKYSGLAYNNKFSGYGEFTAVANGDGSYTVISGSDIDSIYGNLLLTPNPNGTGAAYSRSGYFIFDNQINPSIQPSLDINGLLFTQSGGAGLEFNLFLNGADQPITAYMSNGVNGYVNFSESPVPEAPTMLLLGIGMLSLAIFGKLKMSNQEA